MALDFEGASINTNENIRLADYRGKVVFLDFWASWCAPCILSLPAYETMRNEIGTEDFEIIAINVDEITEDGMEFLEVHPVSYPVIVDPKGDIGIPYGIRSLPTSYIINRDGVIVAEMRSFKEGDEKELKSQIEALIAQ